ncbi:hypothetical protein AAC03nite_06840 [Alicyclobacillus acidoterrestris]|nr:hypothetical protein AAC03nite_06840 [Alicyclobacillus acidoterrestris]
MAVVRVHIDTDVFQSGLPMASAYVTDKGRGGNRLYDGRRKSAAVSSMMTYLRNE